MQMLISGELTIRKRFTPGSGLGSSAASAAIACTLAADTIIRALFILI
jgi:homoserine kinase